MIDTHAIDDLVSLEKVWGNYTPKVGQLIYINFVQWGMTLREFSLLQENFTLVQSQFF